MFTSAQKDSDRPHDTGRRSDLSTRHAGSVGPHEQSAAPPSAPNLTPTQQCPRINEVLVDLHRSLLQYADLCWPWVDLDESAERHLLRDLAARQNDGVRELVLLLDRRGWPVDYGLYPDYYTDLNYIALEHLWPKIIASEQDKLAELHELLQDLAGDIEAEAVVRRCIDVQRDIVNAMQDHAIG